MKRTLLLASFLGLFGFSLYAQNGGSSAQESVNGGPVKDGQNTGAVNNPNVLPRSRSPSAQVTVTPGPQGLPIVNSSASAWPLGPALEENLNFWLNGIPQTGNDGESGSSRPAAQNSQSRTSGQPRPSFEPPPMGGLPSLGAPRPGGQSPVSMGADIVGSEPQVRQSSQNSPAREEIPAGEAPQPQASSPPGNGKPAGQPVSQIPPQNGRSGVQISQAPGQDSQGSQTQAPGQNGQGSQTQARSASPSAAPGNTAPARKVVVVPSPVHYDRAGRRVIDPSWQETMYQMIQAEKQAASPAQAQGEDAGGAGDRSGAQDGTVEAAGNGPAVRETVIVVPGPTVWRIRGTLTVAKGMLALEDDEGVLWYLPGLDRYIGFIDGLDAGEEAILEGYAPPRGSSQERYFQALRLFIDEMAYDLTIPPYGIPVPAGNPGGHTTVIREIERRSDKRGAPEGRGESRAKGRREPGDAWPQDEADDWDDDPWDGDRREKAGKSPASRPAWEHNHKSPWAPPTSVFDIEMDNDSIWQKDEAKRRQRERDSREIWY